MGRAFSLVAVLVIGWAAALLLLYWGLKRTIGWIDPSPDNPFAVAVAFIGLALVPATPATVAWLAAKYGWSVAAWGFGVLAAALAIILGGWLFLNITQS